MAKKALILDNNVVDVVTAEFEAHSSMTWMVCTDDCVAGWTIVDGVLTAPAEPAAKTWVQNRMYAYNALGSQDEMRYDDVKNSTTTWVDAIDAIKAAHPKP